MFAAVQFLILQIGKTHKLFKNGGINKLWYIHTCYIAITMNNIQKRGKNMYKPHKYKVKSDFKTT